MKAHILCSLLLSAVTAVAMAENVPTLSVKTASGDTAFPLAEISSITFDDSDNMLVQQTSQSTVTFATSQVTSMTVSNANASGLYALEAANQLQYRIYDLNGRLCGATYEEPTGLSLPQGLYIVRKGGAVHSYGVDGSILATIGEEQTSATRAMAAKEQAIYFALTDETILSKLSAIDQITFNDTQSDMLVTRSGVETSLPLSMISEMTFGTSQSEVTLTWNESEVTVLNAQYFDGVRIERNGGHVTIRSTKDDEVEYQLSGTSTDGGIKIYSTKKYQLTMMGLTLTNPNGAVINSQTGKKGTLKSQNGYTNTLTDGTTYTASTDADGNVEDQKGCIFSEGQLVFSGKGTLNVTGNCKHAICSDDWVSFDNGAVNILGSVSDGVHANDTVIVQGGTVTITAGSDGIDCEGPVIVRTGENGEPTLTVTCSANGSKGIKSDCSVDIQSGDVAVSHSGSACAEETKTETSTDSSESYVVYVEYSQANSKGNYWTTVALYSSDGTKVADMEKNSDGYYYYDFKQADSGTYYFQSADYTSQSGSRSTYTIQTKTFTGPTSGIDYYYSITSSFSTTGTVRTFTLSTSDGVSTEDGSETQGVACIKADTVNVSGGVLSLTNTGSCYVSGTNVSYCSGVKCEYYNGTAGIVTLTEKTGNASRGISAETRLNIAGGTYTVTNSCAGYSGTNDTYTAKGLKSDGNVVLTDGTITVSMSGTGGKGIKAGGTLTVGSSSDKTGPALTVGTTGSTLSGSSSSTSSQGGMGGWGNMGGGMQETSTGSSAKAIKAQGAACVYGGNMIVTTTTDGAEGLESKTSISIAGGTHYFKCYDDCINTSGIISFDGGSTVCFSNGNDAVDSNYGKTGAITINGGNIFAYSTKGSPEEGLDCDNNSYIVVKSGIAISAGGAQGGGSSSAIGSSAQKYYLGSSPSKYTTDYYYTLCDSLGNPKCTYKFEAACSNSLGLLTASNLGASNVTVKYGTAKPTSCAASVANASGTEVFFIEPTVTTSGTSVTLTTK